MDAHSTSVKSIRIIRWCMLLAVVAYAFLGMRLRPTGNSNNLRLIEVVVILVSMACVNASFFFNRRYVRRAEDLLKDKPDDDLAAKRLRAGYIAIYVVSLAVALYGLVLHFLGAPVEHTAPFFAVGALMILRFRPTVPSDGMM